MSKTSCDDYSIIPILCCFYKAKNMRVVIIGNSQFVHKSKRKKLKTAEKNYII